MKLSKYIIAWILFALAVAVNTLLGCTPGNLWRPDVYNVKSASPDTVDPAVLEDAARRHDLLLFTYHLEQTGAYRGCCTYYTAADDQAALKQKLGLDAGILRNLQTEYTIAFSDFTALSANPGIRNSIENWYVAGSQENAQRFVRELKRQQDYEVRLDTQTRKLLLAEAYIPYVIFGFVCVLLLLYCYLDVCLMKKEVAVRVLHGDSALFHYLRSCIRDSLIFALLLAVCVSVQREYTQIFRFNRQVYTLLFPFLFGIFLVHLSLFRLDPKELL